MSPPRPQPAPSPGAGPEDPGWVESQSRSLPEPDPPEPDPVRLALDCTAQAVSSSDGEIFDTLVLGLSRALGVDLAFVGVVGEGGEDLIRTIAFCDRGQIQPNFEYPLPGTPCEGVVGQRFRWYPQGIQSIFPDPHVKAIGGVGYSAIPLYDSTGRSMGLMAAVDRKPLKDRALAEWVLKIFSVRAAIELERRRADAARQRSEESYRSIFEAAEDALFVHDAGSGAILDVNPRACEVYGYTRDELLALDVGALSSGVPPYTLEQAAGLIGQARRSGPVRMEWHRRNKDGSLHWDEVYIKLVRIQGADRILAVTREITERKAREEERIRLEGQLRQAQKMEAIGQLTGGIAHDFNNILTSTLGYLAMARDCPAARGDPSLARWLERAEGSGQRARELIAQMLTFSRGRRGEPRAMALGPHLAESAKLLGSVLPSSVELVAELDGDCPWVLADPLHIEQVLMNLCINARDAMGGKGRLLVRLGTAKGADGVCASCHQPIRGDFAELAVCDQGPGIAPQVLERIFEPFYSTKEVGKGSGMGLAMVHGIVHEYGGHIRVDTAPGGGTAMRILLPAWAQPEPGPGGERARLAGEPAASGAPGCLRGRVLVAEDEPAVRELMEDLLSGWGLAVELAENGVDACERFAADPDGFDLAILDQTMPRMSGLEAAVELLKLRPGLPVCLYTGHSERLPEGRVAAAGIRAQARKPLDIPAFRVLIEGLLSERR